MTAEHRADTMRVAVCGYMHEVNALADPVSLADGVDLSAGGVGLDDTWEAGPAVRRLRELRPVDIVSLPVWELGASGPLLDAEFEALVEVVADPLRQAVPVDGVLVLGHGAGRTITDLDSDAAFVRALRGVVGDVPIVMVLDFHANVTSELCRLVDVIVGYRTNPHVDIEARTIEAAEHLHRLLDGHRMVSALCRPPLVLPQIAQNTLPGEPLAEVKDLAESMIGGPVWNVSLFGGFSLSDVPECGFAAVATADAARGTEAADAALAVATAAWERRHRYRTTVTPLDVAATTALDASLGRRSPVLLADVADNPGGGAPGTSVFVMQALLDAGVASAVLGLQCDPAVVDAAWVAGVGTSLRVTFNQGSTRPLAPPLTVDATVTALVDAPLVPTKGVYRGMRRAVGRCCALDIDGLRVGVSSRRVQCADDDTLRHVGLDPARAKVVVVKSRGHFRAGFSHLFTDDAIVEVGAPGVATPHLDDVPWEHLRRPVFPLDDVPLWQPTVEMFTAGDRS